MNLSIATFSFREIYDSSKREKLGNDMTRSHVVVATLQETQLKSKCSEKINKCDLTWFPIGEGSLSIKSGMRIIAEQRMLLKRLRGFQSFSIICPHDQVKRYLKSIGNYQLNF